jgi:hypothetical protein
MDGKREDVGLFSEDFGCAVSLMDVEVDHGRAVYPASMSKVLNRDCNIVEHAETRALSAKGMMRPSTKSASPAIGKGILRGAYSSTHRCQRSFYQHLRPR